MRLHPSLSLVPQPRETPASYCSRVAHKLGRTARLFAADCGTDFQKIVDGEPHSLELLTSACGISLSAFAMTTIKRNPGRQYTIGNEQLTRDALSRMLLPVCPHCLSEDRRGPDGDFAPYMRVEWLIEAVRVCPHHQCLLEPVCTNPLPRSLHDFAWHLEKYDYPLGSIDYRGCEEVGGLVRYIVARLSGNIHDHWLDTMPLYAAIKSAEMVGAAMHYGMAVNWRSLSGAEWHASGISGFELLGGGPAAILDFFAQIQRHHARVQSTWGNRAVFGRLFDFLGRQNRDDAFEPLRFLLREHILNTMPVAGGEEVLGVRIERRRLHSIQSAALETGLHPKPLRQKLLAFGIISNADAHLTDNRVVFRADEARQTLDTVSSALTRQAAAEYLNIPRPHPEAILVPPFIDPIKIPTPGGGFRLGFHKDALDAFLARLTAKATPSQSSETEFAPIGDAAKRCCRSLSDIFLLLWEGKLHQVRLDSRERGFKAVMVHLGEVRRNLHPVRTTLSLIDVKNRLGATTQTVKALVDLGAIASSPDTNQINQRQVRVVMQEDLEAFQQTYCSLMNLAKEQKVHFRALNSQLYQAGLRPAFEPTAVRATFYRRSDLAAAHF